MRNLIPFRLHHNETGTSCSQLQTNKSIFKCLPITWKKEQWRKNKIWLNVGSYTRKDKDRLARLLHFLLKEILTHEQRSFRGRKALIINLFRYLHKRLTPQQVKTCCRHTSAPFPPHSSSYRASLISRALSLPCDDVVMAVGSTPSSPDRHSSRLIDPIIRCIIVSGWRWGGARREFQW